MVAPSFLQDHRVRRWLGEVEPAWTLLTLDSLKELQQTPSKESRALTLANDLTPPEVARSAVARKALILLRSAADSGGLKLTATGNLSRSVVAEMIDRFEWPDFDRVEDFRFHRVVNEPDFLPLLFVRHIAQMARLVRPYRGALTPTPRGRGFVKVTPQGSLQSILFQAAFWQADLNYLARGIHGSWPQFDIGVVLWSLSVSAADWQTPAKLTRLCTIPAKDIVESRWDAGSMVTEARILMPLYWYGLLEHRSEALPGTRWGERHFYRKSPLFDRFLAFCVQLEQPDAPGH
jgi:hypothetical protein